jgi:hypothetical protein
VNPLAILGLKAASFALAVFFAYQAIDNNWATDAGIAEGIKRQKVKTDKVQGDFDAFVNRTKAEGDAAKLAAEKRTVAEKLDKEKKDANLKTLRGDLDTTITLLMRERSARASSGYLPAPSATASDPSRATLDRAKFERAMEQLDAGGAGIAKAGDDYRVGLDSLKP